MNQNLAVELTESGYIPDALIRRGIRALLKQRLEEINADEPETTAEQQMAFIEAMNDSAIALLTHKANEQHYEVPAAFFDAALGAHRKYSCCLWDENTTTLDEADVSWLLTGGSARALSGEPTAPREPVADDNHDRHIDYRAEQVQAEQGAQKGPGAGLGRTAPPGGHAHQLEKRHRREHRQQAEVLRQQAQVLDLYRR